MVSLPENLMAIQQRIRAACAHARRDASEITLLAVSKTHPPETIAAAVSCGLTHFGENKVQEAKAKIPLGPGKARWQFIGHLQSNKVRDAVELFEMIQTVDSLDLAREVSKRAGQAAKTMPILLEINVAGEASKFGYEPGRLLAEIKELSALPRLEIHGLMAIPPFCPVPEQARPYFQRLREIKASAEKILDYPLPHLSMGMSGDFEVAIEEGATIIRIGTALFGERRSAFAKPG
jgi:pyridoxal phosphate enzyme (YggS family)